MLEITDVEDRNDQLDVCIVPDTVHGIESASFAEGVFLRRALMSWMNDCFHEED